MRFSVIIFIFYYLLSISKNEKISYRKVEPTKCLYSYILYFKATTDDQSPREDTSNTSSNKNSNKTNASQNHQTNLDYQTQASDYQDFLEDAQIAAYKSIMDRNFASPSKSNNDEDFDDHEDDEDESSNQEFI